MADDFDVEAMLEAPYRKDEIKSSSANGHEERSSKKKKKSHSRSSRSPSSDKRRSKSKDGKKSRDRKRIRSPEKKRSRSKERRRSGSRSREHAGRYRGRRSPLSVPRHNPVSELYRQFLRPHGLVFALTCNVNYGTLYRQAMKKTSDMTLTPGC